ncbi:MAG: iron-sulfur cluster repair di-iron protein [Chitinophagales bacterium]
MTDTNETAQHKVGKMVANDYRTADVFKKYGIDFCCGGGKTLERVCADKNIPLNDLLTALAKVRANTTPAEEDFNSWQLDKLAAYIEFTHHSYVNENLFIITQYAQKVEKAHGQHNPEVIEIANIWHELSEELSVHMKKEELMLFPYIKKMQRALSETGNLNGLPPFGTVQNPVNVMFHEHDNAGILMERISVLSKGYVAPEYACNTYKVLYAKLKEFEADLHKHIHLENNILFPKAILLEQQLNKN